MLELTKVRHSLFLAAWKSLSDVESIFEKQHKGPVITDAKSLYDALERSESSLWDLAKRRIAVEVIATKNKRLEHGSFYTGRVNSDRQRQMDSRNLRRLGSCLRSCLLGGGKISGMQRSRVPDRSSWRKGHQAQEILTGDEFTVYFRRYCVAF